MPVESPSDLIEALQGRDFDRILGTPESAWVDFKRAPYSLADARQKWELCKDVVAFANVGVGYIVIGVETAAQQEELVEVAAEFAFVPRASLDVDAYRKVIRTSVYPLVEGLRFKFYAREDTADDGMLLIEVVSQRETERPFILRRSFEESGAVSGAVAIPVRDGDSTHWWRAEQIHEAIAVARHAPPMSPRRTESSSKELLESTRELIDSAEIDQEWDQRPLLSYAVTPDRPLDVLRVLYGPRQLESQLAEPPRLRSSGFNLQTGGRTERVENGVVARASNVFLLLDERGIFVAIVPGDRAFLQWAVNDGIMPERHRINTLALVEFTYEFFRFAHEVLYPMLDSAEWTCRLDARRFASAGVTLDAGVITRGSLPDFQSHKASSDNLVKTWPSEETAAQDAARALTYFYGLFGHGRDAFQVFTRDGFVSPDAIMEVASSMRG